jgi:hypothetical protein
VKRFAVRLRPDLYEDLGAFNGSRRASRAEKARAEELAACGFVAHCDGTSYGKGEGDWLEWDAERLGPVASHADAAAAELIEAAFEPLTSLDCARLLRGEHGFWVRRYLEQDDPPPAYGLFAHVQLDVLADRVERLVPVHPAV